MKGILVLVLFLGITTSFAFSDEHSTEKPEAPKSEEAQEKADCKKVCVKRDGYGKCIEFEEKCE